MTRYFARLLREDAMSTTLPLATLLELAQNKTQEATRRLGQLQSAQIDAAKKMELLLQYHQEYHEMMQAQMQEGVSSSWLRNFQHFIATLEGAIEQQRALMEQADAKLAQGRTDWQQNKRRQNSFNTLADRVRRQEAQVLDKREQRDNDERVTRQFQLRAAASEE
jgi:flagellar protein FliJ